jgi:hypothetical protein
LIIDVFLYCFSGNLVKDIFSGPELGTLKDTNFVQITDESDFAQPGYDGIIGMAFDTIASVR